MYLDHVDSTVLSLSSCSYPPSEQRHRSVMCTDLHGGRRGATTLLSPRLLHCPLQLPPPSLSRRLCLLWLSSQSHTVSPRPTASRAIHGLCRSTSAESGPSDGPGERCSQQPLSHWEREDTTGCQGGHCTSWLEGALCTHWPWRGK